MKFSTPPTRRQIGLRCSICLVLALCSVGTAQVQIDNLESSQAIGWSDAQLSRGAANQISSNSDLYLNSARSLGWSDALFSRNAANEIGVDSGLDLDLGADVVGLDIEAAASQTADLIQITSNGGTAGDLLQMLDTGEVGIGITPTYTLDLKGSQNVFRIKPQNSFQVDPSTFNGLTIDSSDIGSPTDADNDGVYGGGIEFTQLNNSTKAAGIAYFQDDNLGYNGSLVFSTGTFSGGVDTIRPTMQLNGRGQDGHLIVGNIGSVIPDASEGILHSYGGTSGVFPNSSARGLVIEDSGDAGMSLICPNTNQGRIYFGDPEAPNGGYIIYDHDDGGEFLLKAEDTFEFTGNVGLGADPVTPLDVNGAVTQRASGEPADPANGRSVKWLSNGTGTGDDGDVMIKITDSGGTTKTVTLVDFSAN